MLRRNSQFNSARSLISVRKSNTPRQLFRLEIEPLETRNLLTASPAQAPIVDSAATYDATSHESLVRDYLAQDTSTEYLQSGSSDLRLVEIDRSNLGTTTRFQQTWDGLPIYNAYVTVVQSPDATFEEVYDLGYPQLHTYTLVDPSIAATDAELLAEKSIAELSLQSHSELMFYPSGNQAHLAWQVSTVIDGGHGETPGDYLTVVSASDGQLFSQETVAADYYEQFESDTGVYPRIVINNTIGPAGAREYAAPFDAVVALALGCSGTLIAPDVVLSARHCGGGGGSQILFGDDSDNPEYVATVSSVIFPDGGGSLLDGGDVSIMLLNQDVPASVATPMRLTEDTTSLVGQVAATLGYGYNGVGSNGHGFSSDDIRWGGENIIDRYGSPAGTSGTNIFSTDFDNGTASANTISGSDPNPIEFEATTAPGDSGGPLLVQTNEGEWVIAGVLSGGTTSTSVYGDISWWTGVAPFRSQIETVGGVFLGGGVGTVELDKGTYLVTDTVNITVRDPNAVQPVEVTLVSDSGDTETVTLNYDGGITYSASISTTGGTVATEDGALQVALFDGIEVTYDDPDNGDGQAFSTSDTASIGNIAHFLSTDIPVGIVDNQTRTSELVIPNEGTILDLDVQLDISHTYNADLEVFLIGPDGTRVELFRDVGGSGNNFNDTILDDEANTSIGSGSAPFSGSYSPAGNLSDFDDLSMAGTWTLEVADDATFDQGSLNSWCLFVDFMPSVASGDFNGDGNFDCADVDALTGVIATGTNNGDFDMTGDGLVNGDDLDAWLLAAGEANLGPGISYQRGDANLDGVVDGDDFIVWNANKFSANTSWCSGDFNGDGFIDGSDFVIWNSNKFSGASIVAPGFDPESADGDRQVEQSPRLAPGTPAQTMTRSAPAAKAYVAQPFSLDGVLYRRDAEAEQDSVDRLFAFLGAE